MMTQEEIAALVQIVNRTPLTQAERLWVQALVHKLEREAQKASQPAGEPDAKREP